jgi:excisionase family DNA binding protein
VFPSFGDLMMLEKAETIMTIEEIAEYLKIPKSTVYKLAQEGKIPCQKVGRHWRFRKNTIDNWLDMRSVSCR